MIVFSHVCIAADRYTRLRRDLSRDRLGGFLSPIDVAHDNNNSSLMEKTTNFTHATNTAWFHVLLHRANFPVHVRDNF